MNRILNIVAVFLIFPGLLNAQLFYPADSIPVNLRAGADAVVRSEQIKIDIENERHSVMTYKTAITLLNDDASYLTIISIPYSSLRRVYNIKANAYNETGKLIWTLSGLDIYDFKEFSGPDYLNDERVKAFKFPVYSYPFTIEYSYAMSMEDLILQPLFHLRSDPDIAVEYAGLQYVIPEEVGFKFKALHVNTPTDSFRIGKKLYLSWLEENLPVVEQQDFAPSVTEKFPVIYATPLKNDFGGYKGNFETWRDYGMWMNELLKGLDNLDPQYAEKARNLVSGISNRREKIKALYEYMQKNTRYFNVRFGIGGKQPIHANQVAQNGYGDCKALSNYMKALLKAVGINSYYTLVYAGNSEDIQYDFPCNQFNHAILCVPDEPDTIWLECTDQTSPFNYLGSFTCDRHVLALTPDGGVIMKTPEYGGTFNSIKTFAEINLRGSGDADISLDFTYSGLPFDELYTISESKPDARKEWLSEKFEYSSFELKNEQYSFDKGTSIPRGKADYELFLRDLASKSNGRLYIAPCLIPEASYIWDDSSEIELDHDIQFFDSVRIAIPFGYKVEFLPGSEQVSSKFGAYSSQVVSDDKYVYYQRKFSLNKALYPRDSFREFYDFITRIATVERQMLVLSEL